jgi:hypothetical protein
MASKGVASWARRIKGMRNDPLQDDAAAVSDWFAFCENVSRKYHGLAILEGEAVAEAWLREQVEAARAPTPTRP